MIKKYLIIQTAMGIGFLGPRIFEMGAKSVLTKVTIRHFTYALPQLSPGRIDRLGSYVLLRTDQFDHHTKLLAYSLLLVDQDGS